MKIYGNKRVIKKEDKTRVQLQLGSNNHTKNASNLYENTSKQSHSHRIGLFEGSLFLLCSQMIG